MGKFSGINRADSTGDIPKTPQELQRELDEKMKKFLAKGGKVEKVKAHKPIKQQEQDWSFYSGRTGKNQTVGRDQ